MSEHRTTRGSEDGTMAPSGRGRELFLLLLLVAGELAWICLLLTTVVRAVGRMPNLPSLSLLLPASAVLNFIGRRWHPSRAPLLLPRAAAIVLYFVAVTIAVVLYFRGEVLPLGVEHAAVLVCALALWPLGARLGWGSLRHERVLGEFQFGLVALLTTLLAGRALAVSTSHQATAGLAFVAVGVLALSVSRTETTGGGQPRSSCWAMTATALAAVFALGLLIATLATPDALVAVGRAFTWLWHQIEHVLAVVARWFPEKSGGAASGPGWTAPGTSNENFQSSDILPESFLRVFRIGFAFFVGALALVVVWILTVRAVEWARRQASHLATVGVERLSTNRDRRAYSWVHQMRTHLARLAALLGFGKKESFEQSQTASVRSLYRKLLRWAAANGAPKDRSQTPLEYHSVLTSRWPQLLPEISALTRAYMVVRYSRHVIDENELEELERAWTNLRSRKRHRAAEAEAQNGGSCN